MKSVLCTFCIIVIASVGLGQSRVVRNDALSRIECSTCHTCEVPTKANPCLRSCPRSTMITVHNTPEEGPSILRIDKLTAYSDLYEPVSFSHRAHATMAELSGSCSLCHHYNPPGSILACEACHQPEPSAAGSDLSKPGLKGAYHRLCINCHRQWTDVNSCTDCHALKGAPLAASTAHQPMDHRRVVRPVKKIYETENEDGRIVTFYHDQHVDLFALQCVDCHRNQACSYCHASDKAKETETPAEADPHSRCSTCHAVDEDCGTCHAKAPRPPFDHGTRTGFVLARYHAALSCNQCHRTPGRFTGLKKQCRSCHAPWNPETFRHRVTGLELDEMHGSLECQDCHLQGNFAVPPSCQSCHEDKAYPKDKPGRVVAGP